MNEKTIELLEQTPKQLEAYSFSKVIDYGAGSIIMLSVALLTLYLAKRIKDSELRFIIKLLSGALGLFTLVLFATTALAYYRHINAPHVQAIDMILN